MRPYHWIQVAAIIVSVFLLLRAAPAPDAARWTASPMGWVTGLLMLVFVILAILGGAVGLMVGLRMRNVVDLALGAGAIAGAVMVLIRFLLKPLGGT